MTPAAVRPWPRPGGPCSCKHAAEHAWLGTAAGGGGAGAGRTAECTASGRVRGVVHEPPVPRCNEGRQAVGATGTRTGAQL
jgi:hypothetical protein